MRCRCRWGLSQTGSSLEVCGDVSRRRSGPNRSVSWSGRDLILEAATGTLLWTYGGTVSEIVIEKGNVGSNPATPAPSPCRRHRRSASARLGSWYPIQTSWPPSNRDDTGVTRDWVTVEVTYEHEWVTNFLWFTGTETFSEATTMHMPPNN